MGMDERISTEHVDATGAASYQPLVLNGSAVTIQRGANDAITVGDDGNVTIKQPASGYGLNLPTKTPSSASDTGTEGDISWDTSYIYVCVGANTWKRAALSTW